MSDHRARLEALRAAVGGTVFDAMTQVRSSSRHPLYFLRYDAAKTVQDLTWGDMVEGYKPTPIRGIFLDNTFPLYRAGDPTFGVTREQARDKQVIVIAAEDADALGLKFLNPDGSLDTSGRFAVVERWPMTYTVERVFVKHLAGRPWRYVLLCNESASHARLDQPGENLATNGTEGGRSPW
jgi:hypothetical protein